jgi:ribonuclease BN (tRNA processing enzyme)
MDCREGRLDTDGYEVYACKLNHPVNCMGYKLVCAGKTLVFGGDHEPFRNLYRDDTGTKLEEEFLHALDSEAEEQNARIAAFLQGADLVIWDAQYTAEEYVSRKGWGHSTYEIDIELAARASVRHLILTHHDPVSSDKTLGEREKKYRSLAAKQSVQLDFAKEGMEVVL